MLMTLACTKFVFLLSLSNYFGCYGNLKFPLTYKAKSGNSQFLPFHSGYEILFLHKCLLSGPPRFRQLLSKSLYSFGCYSNVKGKFSKKIFKNFLLRSCKADEADFAYMLIILASTKFVFLLSLSHDFGRFIRLVAIAT